MIQTEEQKSQERNTGVIILVVGVIIIFMANGFNFWFYLGCIIASIGSFIFTTSN